MGNESWDDVLWLWTLSRLEWRFLFWDSFGESAGFKRTKLTHLEQFNYRDCLESSYLTLC